MNCGKCGKELNPDDKFCPRCGEAVLVICNECGTKYDPEGYFCPKCGTQNPNKELPAEEKKLSAFDQELKEKEIQRLINANQELSNNAGKRVGGLYNNYHYTNRLYLNIEPQTDLLTDDEIIKYSPKSQKAKQIIRDRKIKKSNSTLDRIKADPRIQRVLVILIVLIIVLVLGAIYNIGAFLTGFIVFYVLFIGGLYLAIKGFK